MSDGHGEPVTLPGPRYREGRKFDTVVDPDPAGTGLGFTCAVVLGSPCQLIPVNVGTSKPDSGSNKCDGVHITTGIFWKCETVHRIGDLIKQATPFCRPVVLLYPHDCYPSPWPVLTGQADEQRRIRCKNVLEHMQGFTGRPRDCWQRRGSAADDIRRGKKRPHLSECSTSPPGDFVRQAWFTAGDHIESLP